MSGLDQRFFFNILYCCLSSQSFVAIVRGRGRGRRRRRRRRLRRRRRRRRRRRHMYNTLWRQNAGCQSTEPVSKPYCYRFQT